MRAALPKVGGYLAYALVVAVVALPITLERAIETVSISDGLGTFPVEVSLCHNGRSTLDTGILGKVYWRQTGPLGIGAYARTTGPPEAGGTLASYVDPDFINVNVAFIDDPDDVVRAYSTRFRQEVVGRVVRGELVLSLVVGGVLYLVAPHRRLRSGRRGRRAAGALLSGASLLASTAVAALLWQQWPCNLPVGEEYPMPGVSALSFSSPQALEVAVQVRPFVAKNTARLDAKGAAFEASATASFRAALAERRGSLAPRVGETIVLAEADPQGSYVGQRVRAALYADLIAAVGSDAVSLRTIAGDITSNGTVAESAFVTGESEVAPDVPVAVVAGDHDSETTWRQLGRSRMTVVDMASETVGGLEVSGAHDREHKSLFGGIVTNSSGISEEQLGLDVRDSVDFSPRIVLFHQPDAVAGYLGVDSIERIRSQAGSLTEPVDDGIPDVPPGIVDYGHLHEVGGPWVLWNTDGDTVTWTVVDQLGTSGGVENHPTFNRFSTPSSAPLRLLTFRIQYVNVRSGLQTGFATVVCNLGGTCTISERTDVGLPGGQPLTVVRPASGDGT